jgi:hypothetical protein
VKTQALQTYVSLCSRIGTIADERGQTFRAALWHEGTSSDWWLHPVSARLCATHGRSAFEWIVFVLVIDRCARAHGADTLHLHGVPRLLARVLRGRYRVTSAAAPPRHILSAVWPLAAIWARVRALWRVWQTVRQSAPPVWPRQMLDRLVVLCGHRWLTWNSARETFSDQHYAGLDEALVARGFRPFRYVWLRTPPGTPGADPSTPYQRGDGVALQALLTRREVVRQFLSFRSCRTYLRWARRRRFRAAFNVDGFDLFPLFRMPLAMSFLNGEIPEYRLMALATSRACVALPPVATVCHFEWFPAGRAHYEGIAQSGRDVLCTTMQHAANVSQDFYHVDPMSEMDGQPDGCPPPRAAHVFVMADAGFDRFRACGYAPHQLSPTGVTRFDIRTLREAVGRRRAAMTESSRTVLRVLLAPSALIRETELIEAVCAASEGLEGVELCLRQKPGDVSWWPPRLAPWRSRLRLTIGSLVDDLASASLVMFTSSTVADQAFACGIPTWQWRSMHLQGSTLAEIVPLPGFDAVADLRAAFADFQANPDRFRPAERDIDRAVSQIFGHADGREAQRMADRLHDLLAREERPCASAPNATWRTA